MRRAIVLLPILALAACVSAPPKQPPAPPPARPVPPPPPPPAPALPADWQDWPFSAGDWSLRQDESGSAALFGAAGAPSDFAIRCVAATRTVQLARAGELTQGLTGRMTIRATDATRSFPVTATGETPPTLAAQVPANDSHLDAIAFSRGKFLVSIPGLRDLVIPSWPEFAKVVEDCRK